MRTVGFSNIFVWLVLVSLWGGIGPATVGAQEAGDWDLERVLGRLEQINGGEEAIQGVRNVRMQGRLETAEGTHEFTLLKKRPNKFRLILRLDEGTVDTLFNGEEGWRRVKQGDQERFQELSPSELERLKPEVDFDGPLLGPALEGMERSFLGVERIERVDYFVVSTEIGDIQTRHYIDARNFREQKMERYLLEGGEWKLEVTGNYHDYEKVGPLWLARRIERIRESGPNESLHLEKIDLNTALLDRVFELPERAQ